ncbi:MAG: M23 family metallopeptidase [Desulfitobacterium sp.]
MILTLLKAGGVVAVVLFFKSRPDLAIQNAHTATLVGSAILIIMYVAGLKSGLRYIGMLFAANIIIRVLLGGLFWAAPVTGPMTQDFGLLGHHGVDIAVPEGTEVIASRGGIVSKVWEDPIYGLAIMVDHEEGMQTLYAHNSKVLAMLGDSIPTGSPLSLSGNTGKSSGPHVHFEVRKNGKAVDPEKYVYFGGVAE